VREDKARQLYICTTKLLNMFTGIYHDKQTKRPVLNPIPNRRTCPDEKSKRGLLIDEINFLEVIQLISARI